jgi:hypothetical protein
LYHIFIIRPDIRAALPGLKNRKYKHQ